GAAFPVVGREEGLEEIRAAVGEGEFVGLDFGVEGFRRALGAAGDGRGGFGRGHAFFECARSTKHSDGIALAAGHRKNGGEEEEQTFPLTPPAAWEGSSLSLLRWLRAHCLLSAAHCLLTSCRSRAARSRGGSRRTRAGAPARRP